MSMRRVRPEPRSGGDEENCLLPYSLVLTLTRVVLDPLRPSGRKGDPDPLTRDAASACAARLAGVPGHRDLFGDICGQFVGYRWRRGLRSEEARRLAEAAGDALAIVSPAYYLVEEYLYGLSSHRLTVTVKILTEDLGEVVDSWRKVAATFRRSLDARIKLERRSLASQYYSEVYAFYELDVHPAAIALNWGRVEERLLPSGDLRPRMISPLKLSTPPPRPEVTFTPDPVYASRDGIFAFTFYSPLGEGARRNVHGARRKKRRMYRLAIDAALGLKVFLENGDLWLHDPRGGWGAVTGMIHLNPKVVSALWRGAGRRFLRLYRLLLKVMGLMEGFESYESEFWFTFSDDLQLTTFVNAVRLLGGTPPRRHPVHPLDELHLRVLEFIVLKHALDELIVSWDEPALACLADLLCGCAAGRLSEAIRRLRSVGAPTGGECSENLLAEFLARRGRRGLTISELTVLVREALKQERSSRRRQNPQTVARSVVGRLFQSGLVIPREDRRGRVRRQGARPKKRIPVTVYLPDPEHPVPSLLRGRLLPSVKSALEVLLACAGLDPGAGGAPAPIDRLQHCVNDRSPSGPNFE